MWTAIVVVGSPRGSQALCCREIVKDFQRQEFVSEATVEALCESVLPWTAWFIPTSRFASQSRNALAINSGPLSLRMNFGRPRSVAIAASRSITSSLLKLKPTSRHRFSRVNSSITVSHLSCFPDAVRSKMKSQLHT